MAQIKTGRPLSILPMIENHISEEENRRGYFDIAGDSPGNPEDNSYGQQEFE